MYSANLYNVSARVFGADQGAPSCQGTQNAIPGPAWPARATKTPFQGQLGAVRMPKTPFQGELDAVRMPKTPFQGELDVVRFPKWCAKAIKTLNSAEIFQNFCNCNTAAVPK